MIKIILATTSPYRREIFKYLGVPFEVEGSNVDELQLERKNPEELVRELSRMKTEAVANNHKDAIVIGFDSVGFLNGSILEKPKSKEDCFKRLTTLSGNSYQFYTGVHMINNFSAKTISEVAITNVFMREISEGEINRYLKEDPNFNTYSLGYDPVKHISASFTKRIEGSYYNLLGGIPLETVIEMLEEVDYKKE
jgi:septum formation protein